MLNKRGVSGSARGALLALTLVLAVSQLSLGELVPLQPLLADHTNVSCLRDGSGCSSGCALGASCRAVRRQVLGRRGCILRKRPGRRGTAIRP